jgi:hypothetical protein
MGSFLLIVRRTNFFVAPYRFLPAATFRSSRDLNAQFFRSQATIFKFSRILKMDGLIKSNLYRNRPSATVAAPGDGGVR